MKLKKSKQKTLPYGLKRSIATRAGCSIGAVYKAFNNPTKSLCDYRVKKTAMIIAKENNIPEHVHQKWFNF